MKIKKTLSYICDGCGQEYDEKKHIKKCAVCKKEICFDKWSDRNCGYDCERCKKKICEDHIVYCDSINQCLICIINKQNGEQLQTCGTCEQLSNRKNIYKCDYCNKNDWCATCGTFCKQCELDGLCDECVDDHICKGCQITNSLYQ